MAAVVLDSQCNPGVMDRSSRMKVNRTAASLDGRDATVLRLRAGVSERFATNYFHGTWHILSDPAGGRLLGRLCWALSYQRRPDTIVVLHEPELVSNPFDADPSNTIVISNSTLGPFNAAMAGALQAVLRRRRLSDGTVVLQTPGLAAAPADPHAFRQLDEQAYWASRERRSRTWIDRVKGCVVLAAPPPVLRAWGLSLGQLGERFWRRSDHAELNWPASTGEVQVFPDFADRVDRAATARASLYPRRIHEELTAVEREVVWQAASMLLQNSKDDDQSGP
jgi:hypothetical protein